MHIFLEVLNLRRAEQSEEVTSSVLQAILLFTFFSMKNCGFGFFFPMVCDSLTLFVQVQPMKPFFFFFLVSLTAS